MTIDMMTTPAALIEQTSRRLLNQRKANIFGFFLPLMVATGVGCSVFLFVFSLPLLLVLVPLALLGTFMILSLAQAKQTVKWETIAALLDEKTDGQERFLTYATLPQDQANHTFFSILQRQATRKASSFEPSQDLPFRLDRRVPVALLGAALSVLLVFVLPSAPIRSFLFSQLPDDLAIEKLENIARELTKSADLQKQAAGAQLVALVEELKDPALSPQEKQHLIEEAQQKINLPLPQLLPFDLKLFASESKNERPGNQGDQPQPENSPLAKSDQNLDQLKKSPAAAAGQEPQSGPPQDGEKSEQSQPREAGGGIQFNLPQPQAGEKKEQTGNEPGQQQQASQDQAVNNQGPGTDPNRPGGGQEQNLGAEKDDQSPGPQQQQQQGTGTTTGGGAGERFLQPGEQPGGFFTEDTQFVKVRIPIGQDAPEGGKRTEGRGGALPKTPYSNAPLKEGAPDQPKPKQPIPLEYRAILQ